ncbi:MULTISPECIES: YfhJ family protein [Bacillaceae]|uniref:YfhJ family protein n=1 Tax=Evansella alkalicola TaxID=745819 RepID=A0ABS6JQ81_9BACI|nr:MULTISPECIES: YfhJ family protein [Bacillaceae]MBU9719864.1 YfhJ family protein [Bacillus alkalicola]
MNDYFERLTNKLLEQNEQMSYSEARTWVEILWEDFESTSAKAGRKYRGSEMTEKIIEEWINRYGPKLHEVLLEKPRYRKLFKNKEFYH